MAYVNTIGNGNFNGSLLRAKPLARILPHLGGGMNLFGNQPQAVGNSRLQFQSNGANIRIVV